jgi:hypothetical protein
VQDGIDSLVLQPSRLLKTPFMVLLGWHKAA